MNHTITGCKAKVSTDEVEVQQRAKVANTATVAGFIDQIKSSWNEQLAGIFKTGKLLIQAKDELDHGQFTKMIEEQLPFRDRTAQRLMAIARHPILANPTHVSVLPTSWGTLHRLTELPHPVLEEMLADGTINCNTERKDVEELIQRMNNEGSYKFERVPQALNVLIKFMEKWPDPTKLAPFLSYEMEEGKHALVQRDVGKLLEWLAKLHEALQREYTDFDEPEVAVIVKDHKAEMRAKAERQGKKKGVRRGFASPYYKQPRPH